MLHSSCSFYNAAFKVQILREASFERKCTLHDFLAVSGRVSRVKLHIILVILKCVHSCKNEFAIIFGVK